MVKIAINGFGRIGRLVLRAAIESGRKDLQFVAINDMGKIEDNAYLLQYDSVHGKFNTEIKHDKDTLIVGKHKIKTFSERDPLNLPWGKLGVDIVMECTGVFTDSKSAAMHITAGAKKVLISAPGKDADKTIVFGVNEKTLTKKDKIVSNGSCTTNCLAPVLAVLDKHFGIKNGWMTTVHSYTGDQQLLDKNHKDYRRARSAAMSMIPTTTGAAAAIGSVLPQLAGKLDGIAIRVPTPDVSVVELSVNLKNKTTADEINKKMKAAKSEILGYNDLPLVSVDFVHDPHSSVFDSTLTRVVGGTLAHITAWYDNEWGFSNRMCDTASLMGKKL